MAKQGEVYKIVNKQTPSTLLYIGSTNTDLKTRWQKHISHSKRNHHTPFYNEINKNSDLYEIRHLCYVYHDTKRELLAREAKQIRKYKPLANINRAYNEEDDTAETDSDSDSGSVYYSRDDSDGSVWDTDDERLTQEEKNKKYYKWGCVCSGAYCSCKKYNRVYTEWHVEEPEMFQHKYKGVEYRVEGGELKNIK